MELLIFVLAAYGLTQILVYSDMPLIKRLRPEKESLRGYGKLFHCPMCMGFWTGVLLFSINDQTELFTFDYNIFNAFILGCLSSGTSYLLSVLINDFGLNLNHRRDNE